MGFFQSLIRYLLVGGALTVTYILLTIAIIELLQWPALLSSISAFALNLPISYLGHRYGTFQAEGSHRLQARRFTLAMTVSFTVSTISIVVIVNVMSKHYALALLATAVLVPMINFVVLKQWVFASDREF
ncbi:MAG: GtrA family protein [Gammaproteobacteria bacterium]|nr:GtrA family protein [Gammaproteobacteria bacterium]